MEDHINILKSNRDEEIGGNKDPNLELAKEEMGEARKENERLKLLLSRVVKDYQSLQMGFSDILQQDKQEEATKATGTSASHEENELVSLSLGISSVGQPIMDEKKNSNRTEKIREKDENFEKGLALGLDIRFDPSAQEVEARNNPSTEGSFGEDGKEERVTEICPPSKVLKTNRTGDKSEASQHTQLKKARVSIRARCDTQTINDGCQWRKYGQKIAKGNPCPRSYYRCTISRSCPVRKQVQRCAEDTSILIATYEGTHNHPLPTSAATIATTTSAAASMLQSHSMSSQQGLANSNIVHIINSNGAYNLNALNLTSTCQQFSRPQQLYFPNSSISTSNSHPTITVDLTAPPTASYLGKFTPGFSSIPKYSSTNLNFSSTFSPLQFSMLQSTWSPNSGYFNYGGLITQNLNQNGSLMDTGKQPFQGHIYQPKYMSNQDISQQPLPDSIAASTKAITANPNFQSALVAALTTYVSTEAASSGVRANHVWAENATLNLELGGDTLYAKNTVYTSSQHGIGCASSRHLSIPSFALNAQQGNLINFPPPQAFKSSFGSPSNKSNYFLEQRK